MKLTVRFFIVLFLLVLAVGGCKGEGHVGKVVTCTVDKRCADGMYCYRQDAKKPDEGVCYKSCHTKSDCDPNKMGDGGGAGCIATDSMKSIVGKYPGTGACYTGNGTPSHSIVPAM